jgi:uncharacterized surface protein with fasciclin (FAS1) repeats
MKVGLFIAAAAAALSAVQGQKSIVKTVKEMDGHMAKLISKAPEEVRTALGGDGLTFFLPEDAAWEMLGARSDAKDIAKDSAWAHLMAKHDYARSLLAEFLTAHVLSSVVKNETFQNFVDNGTVLPTLNPQAKLTMVSRADAETGFGLKQYMGVSLIKLADIDATNGVVHVICCVICPYNIMPWNMGVVLVHSPDFSILAEALSTAGLLNNLTDATTNPWTVFAPTNKAFGNALTALDLTKEDLFGNKELLKTILQAHVMKVDCDAACVKGQQTVSTIGGEKIPIDDISLTKTDRRFMNGFVHFVDEVIIPPSLKAVVQKDSPSLTAQLKTAIKKKTKGKTKGKL